MVTYLSLHVTLYCGSLISSTARRSLSLVKPDCIPPYSITMAVQLAEKFSFSADRFLQDIEKTCKAIVSLTFTLDDFNHHWQAMCPMSF